MSLLSAALIVAGAQAVGTQTPAAVAQRVVPFTIQVPDAVLRDLKQRLSRVRFADEIPGAGWDYGTNLTYLKTLVGYWRDTYDWRAQERRLNQFDQFKTRIDGLDIHFIHQRSRAPNARPLLLLNGWPSSIVEYTKVIGPLTDPVAFGGRAEDSFHVLIPVMPGFGFSDKPREPGYDAERMAALWTELMARLGYTAYGVHGSDWGSGIAHRLALRDAAHVTAVHLAGCPGAPPPAATTAGTSAGTSATPPASGSNATVNQAHNLGYQEIQSTRPQTLGHLLSDSPAGLASWIVEKWYAWSDHNGNIEEVFTKDELLTNIMFYWVTNTGASSARLYYENRHLDGRLMPTPFTRPDARVTAPTGCGAFPRQYDRRDIPVTTDSAAARAGAEARYNVVHFTTMPRGGHFPALEAPDLWLADLRAFFRDRR
ncbi:MAG: epoxide hydrolase [Acidobacteria bacterium]|nr:epoxide hydrolase [Acidobacteriota bacterium]